jgi:hypothetical protein
MKNIKLITQVAAVCFIMSLNTAFAQQDSLKNPDLLKTNNTNNIDTVFYVEDCTYSYFETDNTKDSIRENNIILPQENKFYNISRITFKKDNNLDLLNTFGESKSVNLNFANEFKMNKGTESLSGAILGGCLGGLLGLVIGASTDNSGTTRLYSSELGKPAGLLIGAVIGGFIGGITGNSIENEESINLKEIREINRQSELIEFLKTNE